MIKKGINIFLISVIVLVAFFSCQKIEDNKIPPTISIIGSNPVNWMLGCTYVDQNVNLSDDQDMPGTMQFIVTGDTIPDSAGTYYVNYSATDSDGNATFAQRKVVVGIMTPKEYEGTYTVKDSTLAIGGAMAFDTAYTTTLVVKTALVSLVKINNICYSKDSAISVLFLHDSTGIIQINSSFNDNTVSGSGTTNCDKSGFHLLYFVMVKDSLNAVDTIFHRSTFSR